MSEIDRLLTPDNVIIYFDFDNTITDFDVLDSVIAKFATGTAWQEAEKRWELGSIGARDCLDVQMRSLRTTPKALADFLAPIKLDPAFSNILKWLRMTGIEHGILSDNFSPIIEEILTNNQIEDVPVFANSMRFQSNSTIPSFPYYNEDCPRCAHCKKVHLLERPDAYIIYVGDGRSDICPAQIADRVYARSFLLTYLTELGQTPISFNTLSDVLSDLRKWWITKKDPAGYSELLA